MPRADAARVAALPPVSIMFAALLGYNPVQTLFGHALSRLPASPPPTSPATLFPSIISAPFAHGLAVAFDFAIAACLIAAVASLMRGGKYVHETDGAVTDEAAAVAVTTDSSPAAALPSGASPAAALPTDANPTKAIRPTRPQPRHSRRTRARASPPVATQQR